MGNEQFRSLAAYQQALHTEYDERIHAEMSSPKYAHEVGRRGALRYQRLNSGEKGVLEDELFMTWGEEFQRLRKENWLLRGEIADGIGKPITFVPFLEDGWVSHEEMLEIIDPLATIFGKDPQVYRQRLEELK